MTCRQGVDRFRDQILIMFLCCMACDNNNREIEKQN